MTFSLSFFAPICSQMMSGVKRGNGSERGGERGTNKKRLSRTERSCPHASQHCGCDVLKPADLQHVQEEEGGEEAFVGGFAIICCKQFSKGEWGAWKRGGGLVLLDKRLSVYLFCFFCFFNQKLSLNEKTNKKH